MEEYILRIKDLHKHYKDFSLKGINIDLKPGKILGFIGPNGAGKSTTIKSILNIIPFDSGQILIDGMDIIKKEIAIKERVSFVGEEINLYSHVPAKKVYHFKRKFYDQWDDKLFAGLIQRFNLNIERPLSEYSKGMKVKFALALALSYHAKLLVLDEPTSSLDPLVRDQILDILLETVEKDGSSVFFSSHITEDIQKIATDVAYINNGEILLSDLKENLLNDYNKIEFKNNIPDYIKEKLNFYKKNIAIVKDLENIKRCMKSDDITEMQISNPALDDILLLLIQSDKGA